MLPETITTRQAVDRWRAPRVDNVFTVAALKSSFVVTSFYRAMLCIRGTSHGPVSVCPSVAVTSRSSTKTAEQIGLVFGM